MDCINEERAEKSNYRGFSNCNIDVFAKKSLGFNK